MDRNNSTEIEQLIRQILVEKLGSMDLSLPHKKITKGGVISVEVPAIQVTEQDRMNTGRSFDMVYTKDLFTLKESNQLGCGIMEMKKTTFPWTLNYCEIDYVIKGELSILIQNEKVTAKEGELILIPNGSSIQFSVPEYARFLYVTYPADWANQP